MINKPPLWPHQQGAKDFVDGKDAAMLAMVMRSGKSRVTVELLDERQAMNTLLICPKSVLDVWPEQFREYARGGVECKVLKNGSLEKRTKEAEHFSKMAFQCDKFSNASKVFIINIEAFWREPFFSWAMKQPWDAFVMDESHRLKSPSGKASKAAEKLARNIPFKLQLSGTPMPHDPGDLLPQFNILNPSVFNMTMTRFRMHYGSPDRIPGCPVPIYKYPKLNVNSRLFDEGLYEQFQEKFQSMAYVVGEEVLNLPEPLHMVRHCELSPSGRRVYNDLEKDFYAEVEAGEITASNALVRALRLQQAASGFARLADSQDEVEVDTSKKELLEDLLADLDEPVVVFCRFHHDLDNVHDVCQKLKIGSMELSGRRNDLAEWQLGSTVFPVLAVQTQAGGVGIDLSRAKVAIYYSLGLSLGDHLQSLARLQAKDMQWNPAYYYLIAKNTVDEKVYRALHERKDVIEEIMKR